MTVFLQKLLRFALGRTAKKRPAAGPCTEELLQTFSLGPDIPCDGCGFNLRGLPARGDGKCPECGKSATVSRMNYLCSHTGRDVDVFIFFQDALRWHHASQQLARNESWSALEFCQMICRYAVDQAGDAAGAGELLGRWDVRRSEEVGALVYALAAVGFISASEGDSPGSFDALPSIRQLILAALNQSRERENVAG